MLDMLLKAEIERRIRVDAVTMFQPARPPLI